MTLFAANDDVTGEVLALLFRAAEDAHGYFLLVRMIVTAHGRPAALYHDRHSIFRVNAPETVAEQLTGEREPATFGRLLDELRIGSIPACSPQAKGRVERLFGMLQDRLVSMLWLVGATNEAEATACLVTCRDDFNTRFMVPAAEEGDCYRAMKTEMALDTPFCFKDQRTVGMDNTVRFGSAQLQLLPGPVPSIMGTGGGRSAGTAGRQPRGLVPRRMSRADACTAGSAAVARTRRSVCGRHETGEESSVEARSPTAG